TESSFSRKQNKIKRGTDWSSVPLRSVSLPLGYGGRDVFPKLTHHPTIRRNLLIRRIITLPAVRTPIRRIRISTFWLDYRNHICSCSFILLLSSI
ncbi:MAG: hypothetical protein KKF01_10910, partial [Proteobacteria bacterium]|nr:hypothetical protein [Pseudomonadota bacterium]